LACLLVTGAYAQENNETSNIDWQEDSTELVSINDIINEAYKKFNNQQLKKLEKDRLPFTWDNAKGIIKDLCRNDAQYNACSQSIRFDTADKV
jgi:hypothetical protein